MPRSLAIGQRLRPPDERTRLGQVSEWSKEVAWKAAVRQRTEGSNPSLTAISSMQIPLQPLSEVRLTHQPPLAVDNTVDKLCTKQLRLFDTHTLGKVSITSVDGFLLTLESIIKLIV